MATLGPALARRSVVVMFEPSATGLGVLVLVKTRSAPSGNTNRFTEPELLPGFGSVEVVLMLAVLV